MARDLINANISKTSELEFKTTVIRILSGLEKSTEDMRECLTTEIKELESSQAEIKNAITEMQSQTEAIKMRKDKVQEGISDKEDKIMENNETKKKREKRSWTMKADLENSATY